ncbi:MAG: PHP domain-containing protein, partial [Nanoarchaeota archaeon]|nr:PHP domain-containing protein [Nanoarchaeota archaeon]
HTHAGSDKNHTLKYSPKELIDAMADRGYEVFSITNHDTVTYSRELKDYAKKKGILLIPGIEKRIENKEVIILNADKKAENLKTFDDLRRYKEKRNIFVIAPHPFYPDPKALHSKLIENIGLFDGIEFSHFYLSWWTFNTKAAKLARKQGLPLIGTSDCHIFEQLNRTYTMIDADKNIDSVFEAMKNMKTRLVTTPLPLFKAIRIITTMYLKY